MHTGIKIISVLTKLKLKYSPFNDMKIQLFRVQLIYLACVIRWNSLKKTISLITIYWLAFIKWSQIIPQYFLEHLYVH